MTGGGDQALPDLMALSRYDDALRQVPADPAGLRAALVEADARRAALDPADGPGRARLDSYAGEVLRILGDTGGAVARHRLALGAPGLTARAAATYRLRLAEAIRCGGDPATAEPLMRAVLAAGEADPATAPPQHFSLQHLGKCLLDLGRLDEAEEALREALRLREATGDAALAESTRAALRLLADRRRD